MRQMWTRRDGSELILILLIHQPSDKTRVACWGTLFGRHFPQLCVVTIGRCMLPAAREAHSFHFIVLVAASVILAARRCLELTSDVPWNTLGTNALQFLCKQEAVKLMPPDANQPKPEPHRNGLINDWRCNRRWRRLRGARGKGRGQGVRGKGKVAAMSTNGDGNSIVPPFFPPYLPTVPCHHPFYPTYQHPCFRLFVCCLVFICGTQVEQALWDKIRPSQGLSYQHLSMVTFHGHCRSFPGFFVFIAYLRTFHCCTLCQFSFIAIAYLRTFYCHTLCQFSFIASWLVPWSHLARILFRSHSIVASHTHPIVASRSHSIVASRTHSIVASCTCSIVASHTHSHRCILHSYLHPILRLFLFHILRSFLHPILCSFLPRITSCAHSITSCAPSFIPSCACSFVPFCAHFFVPSCSHSFVPSCTHSFVPSSARSVATSCAHSNGMLRLALVPMLHLVLIPPHLDSSNSVPLLPIMNTHYHAVTMPSVRFLELFQTKQLSLPRGSHRRSTW